MSQQLIPIDGGVQEVQTEVGKGSILIYSQQYISANKLESRPTEWIPGGRPIYRRLPASCETYQVDFFNIVPAANTAVQDTVEQIGYVYVPWGAGLNSESSIYVSTSDSKQDLLIKGGSIVWKYGKTEVLPTIVNLPLLGARETRYELAYQLLYDDSPIQKLYRVSDFSLGGQPLTITSSTDTILGWRHPAVNAFLVSSSRYWTNEDTFFPPYAQPTSSFIQWESDLPMAYSQVTLRLSPGSSYQGTATFSYFDGVDYAIVDSVEVQSDTSGQFFQFTMSARLQTGWRVEFSSLSVAVSSLSVTGVITLLEPQSSPSTRAILVMYPEGTMPAIVQNSAGNPIQATYCPLAVLDISKNQTVEKLEDARYIIHRDYTPVADWLTRPFDTTLLNLYEQVEDYPSLWMSPSNCMKQEYIALNKYQITVET